ncbi:sperm-associated antigen 7 homolog, partial [Caerostris extrusa]
IEKSVNEFIQDSHKNKFKFEPMDKVYRNIIHDVAEIAGLCAYAFGEDEVDRYVMIFKKNMLLLKMNCRLIEMEKNGIPQKLKKLLCKTKEKLQEIEESKKRKRDVEPTRNYADRYEKFVGRDAGLAAAKIATPNKQFGFVPSEQKKDQRSIEQTLADIQAKKKLKKSNHQAADTVN